MPEPTPRRDSLGGVLLVLALAAVVGLTLRPALERALDPAAQTAYAADLARQAERDAALEPWWDAVRRLALATLAVILLAVGATFGALAYAAWRYLPARAQVAAAVQNLRGGLPPALVQGARGDLRLDLGAERNLAAEVARAVYAGSETPGAPALRLPASPRPLLEAPAAPEPDAAPAYLPLATTLTVDPHNPHWLLVGGTGSGKSVAAHAILERIARQVRAEFVILERDGVNWNAQATATDLPGYVTALAAVEQERQRRVALLRAADVDHISQLAQPPPYLVVLIEEAESAYSDLARLARGDAQAFTLTLRGLAALGRKQGIMLVAVTQTGAGQVFDVPTRRNFGNRLLFRSELTVGDAWGLPRSAGLSTLATGTAYDLAHAGLVMFPFTARPRLAPARLALAAPVHDPVLEPVHDAVYRELAPATAPEPARDGIPVRVPAAVPQDDPPGDADKLLIYHRWKALGSYKAVERELYDQEGGVKFYWVRDAVAELQKRRGQRPAAHEGDI